MAPSTDLRKLDAEAAVVVDGWTEVREERGDVRGKPRTGLRRPVIAYSTDLRRSLQLARRALRGHGAVGNKAELIVTVTPEEIIVESLNPKMGSVDGWEEWRAERTDALPELLTRAALHVARMDKK